MKPSVRKLRALLVLGRVSNLPTVWSNCLAAWLLNDGASWTNFPLLCAGATLLYTGGMFLNDAFDAEFDRRHRAERPIPSGQINALTVWLFGLAALALGWIALLPLGIQVALVSLLLVACILVYDAFHKRMPLAPALMAACRFLLYLAAGLATQKAITALTLWHAGALAAYIIGLSYLARGESAHSGATRWPLALVAAPLVVNGMLDPDRPGSWIAIAGLAAWVAWCLRHFFRPAADGIARTVSGLLAGIVVVDWSAVAPPINSGAGIAFAGLFLLALALQRTVPAT